MSMKRLTRKFEEAGEKVVWYGEREAFLEGETGFEEAYKLAEYEDLEEQLEKVYGEHDGLLETAVKSLVKYSGEKPNKARLLTDEDADRWEEYKRLEERGLLLKKEDAVDEGYLYDWYIHSVCDGEPVWTEAHLDELFNDFILIPKEAAEAALKEMEK